jgi:hypothetical protein
MASKETLDAALEAIDRLLQMFKIERYVYLALSGISFLLLLYVVVELLISKSVDKQMLTLIFGSSGLVGAASVRVTFFFSKAFGIVEYLLKQRR